MGSLCLIPLVGKKLGVMLPLTKTETKEVEIQDIIRVVSLGGKLK